MWIQKHVKVESTWICVHLVVWWWVSWLGRGIHIVVKLLIVKLSKPSAILVNDENALYSNGNGKFWILIQIFGGEVNTGILLNWVYPLLHKFSKGETIIENFTKVLIENFAFERCSKGDFFCCELLNVKSQAGVLRSRSFNYCQKINFVVACGLFYQMSRADLFSCSILDGEHTLSSESGHFFISQRLVT